MKDSEKLISLIKKNYSNRNYKYVLYYFNTYLNKGYAIFEWLLHVYLDSKIKLGYLDEAGKDLMFFIKLYPDLYDNFNLALMYITCNKMNEFNELLKKSNFNSKQYHIIAKRCLYYGKYEKAEELFNLILEQDDKVFNDYIKGYLKQIELYKNDNTVFKEKYYYYMKSIGESLEPGHIIYALKVNDNVNDDLKKNLRPYMIWKIIDKKIYAFGITKNISNKGYVLYQQNYLNRNFDRQIKDNLVCINEKDIEKVIDKVREEDFKIIIENMIYTILFQKQYIDKNLEMFMKDMIGKIEININDVIAIRDEDNKNKFYFIVDENMEQYKCLEVKMIGPSIFELENNEIVNIEKDIPYYVIKLKDENKESLLNQVNNKLIYK